MSDSQTPAAESRRPRTRRSRRLPKGRRAATSPASKTGQGDEEKSSSWLVRCMKKIGTAWTSSLQLRTISLTALASFIATLLLAWFVIHQVTTGLFDSRFNQVEAEATHGLTQARQVFENAATGDQESTASLVTDMLSALSGEASSVISREFVLMPLHEDQNLFVDSMTSSGVSTDIISADLLDQVREDTGIYWQSVGITDGSAVSPGLAFGTQVVLPPGNYYALFFVYDLSDVQQTLDYLMSLLFVVGLMLIVINVVIAYLTTRAVVRPVRDAALTAEWLSSGDFSVRMKVDRRDEVGRLSESFNTMADNIQDQITQLADLSRLQQRFVSDVSHELRTPLTTVSAASELLYNSRDEFSPANRRSAELLFHQVDRFEALLADLLEVSRFDAGAAEVAAESTDILDLVADVALDAQPLAHRNNTELSIVADGAAFNAEVDSRRIERILRNLINNAIEHSEERPVDVIVAEDEDCVAVVVRDHGIGMSDEEREHVFDRFWRADPARARTTGGSGLGLSIALEDTRLHNGSLDVWGQKGEGAAFRLVLPRVHGQTLPEDYPIDLPPVYNLNARRSALDIIAPDDGFDDFDDFDDFGSSSGSNRLTEQKLVERPRGTSTPGTPQQGGGDRHD